MDASDNKDVKLSAEVEPFIPQKKGLEGSLVSMSLSGEAGGGGGGGGMGGGGGGVETTPIPSYLITCYPFVQENQPNRQHPMYNGGELRWQQPNPSPGGSYLAYPILSSPQPPVSNDYTYYQIMPAPCPPVMGFYQPFPGTYASPVQAGVVNPVSADVSERPLPLGPAYGMASQRGRGMIRPNVLPKQQLGMCQPPRGRRPPTRSVAVQKEVCTLGPDGRTKTVMLVDAAQQTDFPGEVSGRCAGERASSDSHATQSKPADRHQDPAAPTYTPNLYQTGSPGYPPGYTSAGTPYKVPPTQSNGAPPPYTPTPTPYPTAMYPIRSAYPQQNIYAQGAYYTQPVYAAQPHVIHHTTVVQPNSIPSTALYPAPVPVPAPRNNGMAAMGMVAGTTMAMSAGTLLTTPQHPQIGGHPVTVPTYRPQGTPGYSYVPPHW